MCGDHVLLETAARYELIEVVGACSGGGLSPAYWVFLAVRAWAAARTVTEGALAALRAALRS